MGPLAITAVLFVALTIFGFSAIRRLKLMLAGMPENRFDRLGDRLLGTWRYAFAQEKMSYYQPAGLAHKLIFSGFMVLTIRTIVLVGRGFSSDFNLWILAPDSALGRVYEFAKDSMAFLVLFGISTFFYFRVIKPQKRMTLSGEAILILGIIATMMISDMVYDGAGTVLRARYAELCSANGDASLAMCQQAAKIGAPYPAEAKLAYHFFPSPGGSAFAAMFKSFGVTPLVALGTAGYWTHTCLVFIFLNLLPHSKHFHVITAIPNVFHRDLTPKGRLRPMAPSAEALMEKIGAVAEMADPGAADVGIGRIGHASWKAVLDFYTCTECGRCSDNCPAHRTGKMLSPKQLTLDLRNHAYANEANIIELGLRPASADGSPEAAHQIDLVPAVIHPDVLWGCTTCRACEEQCPVMISYVDKIVDMRRNLILVKGEVPHTLQKPFQGMEVNGNPWNLSRMDRSAWSDGLDIPMMAEKPDAEVLYWVGCAASYDDRAKKVARATAGLMKQAGVDFAILGQEETCTGDPARRAGNEFLFAMLAETNSEVVNTYKAQGGARTVVTACPHCFNTLKNEYPDFGLHVDVVHHSDFLTGLLAKKQLTPVRGTSGKVVYHDSCYLGRYNGVYESPRDILKAIPGVELVEPDYWTKSRGLCCGAGGAQMFMEEQNTERVNVKRTLQLLDTGAKTVASGCPFCMTMLSDGLKAHGKEEEVRQVDIAELLWEACETRVAPAPEPQPEPEADTVAAE